MLAPASYPTVTRRGLRNLPLALRGEALFECMGMRVEMMRLGETCISHGLRRGRRICRPRDIFARKSRHHCTRVDRPFSHRGR